MGKATKPKVNRETKEVRARRELNKARKELAELLETAKKAANPRTGIVPVALRLAIQRLEIEVEVKSLRDQFGHRQGTVETHAQLNALTVERRTPPLDLMHQRGQLTDDQYRAYVEIEGVSTSIKRGVEIGCCSIEARVDNGGGNRDMLVESIGRIRLEAAFTEWRDTLPTPRQMILDVIATGCPMNATARRYNKSLPTIRKRVLAALDSWAKYRSDKRRSITEETVGAIYTNLQCGELRDPQPKAA